MENEVQVVPGMTVYGSDEDKVGKIVGVGANHIVVEKGFFFPTEYYIPFGAITGAWDDGVYLGVTKDEALNQNWGEQPADWNSGSTSQEATYGQADPLADADMLASAETDPMGDAGYVEGGAATSDVGYSGTDAADTDTEVIAPDYVAADDRAASGDEAVRVPVYEEELRAVTRDVDRGSVRIEKELVTEDRTITVPVTEERVRVTRVDTDDPGAVGDYAFQDGVIEVPIRGQEVEVETTAHQTGEVVVEKEAVTRSEEVSGTVRREKVHVQDDSISTDRVDRDRR